MNKIHVVSGNNFHGNYRLTLRGPADGFYLSKSQARKYEKELCGMNDCTCGGGYGDGPDSDTATIEETDYDKLWLTPANIGE